MFLWNVHSLSLSHVGQFLLTEHNGQHLSRLLLPCVHASESCVGMRMRHRPKRRVRPSVWQILHLTAHPDRKMLHLVVVPRVLSPLLLLQVQLRATARRMTDAAVVLRVHRGQTWVLHWSCLGMFAPQASWEQIGLRRTWRFYTLLRKQGTNS